MKLLVYNYEDELERLARSALEIKVLMAFLTDDGLNWLRDTKAACIEFIVGIDLGITSSEAIRKLQERGAHVLIFKEPGKMFHPKAIYMRTEEEGELLIVGSNNLTGGGISSNHELSILAHRHEWNDSVFREFLAHFDRLKLHDCCGIPGDKFFQNYKQTLIRQDLAQHLNAQGTVQLDPVPPLPPKDTGPLGEFIRLIATEFPQLSRSQGQKIKNHPLKRKNDDGFRPLFNDIVAKVSQGCLTGHSQLNIGGNWYQIPNIFVNDEAREPWANVDRIGRLVLQIHFSEEYREVHFSMTLLYNLHHSIAGSQMPDLVDERLKKLLDHLAQYSSEAQMNLPIFRHWRYKDHFLWSKPVMTFSYSISALPDDETLYADLICLAVALNDALAIP